MNFEITDIMQKIINKELEYKVIAVYAHIAFSVCISWLQVVINIRNHKLVLLDDSSQYILLNIYNEFFLALKYHLNFACRTE